ARQTQVTGGAIKSRLDEDIYVSMSGFGGDNEKTANFRVYINPLINWVWLGFVVLAFGTFICVIPQGVVDKLSPRPRTRLGRMADVGVLLLAIGAVTFAGVQVAHSAPPD